MKNNKGITLIALIVTIIIMLIIAGVTISMTIDGGLIDNTKKAAFQAEVRQIQEALENRETVIIAKNNGRIPAVIDISFDDLDIDSKIIEKYRNKLVIFQGDLYYDADKCSTKEKKWLEEISVHKITALYYSIATLAKSSEYNQYGINKIGDIIEDVKASKTDFNDLIVMPVFIIKSSKLNYPIVYAGGSALNAGGIDFSTFHTSNYYKITEGLWMISRKYNIEFSDLITNYNNGSLEGSPKTEIDTLYATYPTDQNFNDPIAVALLNGLKFLVINDDENEIVIMGNHEIIDVTDTKQVMNETEFAKQFSYIIENSGITITGIETGATDLVVPSNVYKTDGTLIPVKRIQEGAFRITTVNITQGAYLTGDITGGSALIPDYKDTTKTLQEIKTEAAGVLNALARNNSRYIPI